MNSSEICTPLTAIERKLAERNVLTVEINAIMSLRTSKKNTELERKLGKEYYDFLEYKVLTCDKEISKVFYEELPVDLPDRGELLDIIETEGVELWTYKSDVPVKPNTLTMDAEAYKALSYREKVERKIAEYNIMDYEINAIRLRCKAKKINEHETQLLVARESELTMSLIFCIKELWRISWDEVLQGTQEDNDVLQRFKEANITKKRNDELFKSLKNMRQKHV
jgi:hypothetical protein